MRHCVLGKNKCCFLLCGQAVYPLWEPSLTIDMQTEQLLCWSGMTDTHTTSGSNEEGVILCLCDAVSINKYIIFGDINVLYDDDVTKYTT